MAPDEPSPGPAARAAAGRRSSSVGRRLAAAFGAVLVLLGVVVVWSVVTLGRVAVTVERARSGDLVRTEAAATLRNDVAGLLQGQAAYVLDGGEGRAAFATQLERVDGAVGRLGALIRTDDGDGAARLGDVRAGLGALRAVDAEVWSAVQGGRTDAARALVDGPATLVVGLLTDDADALLERARAGEDAALAAVDRMARVTLAGLAGLGAFALALGTALAVHAARRIRRPLADLERAARQAAAGDLDVTLEPQADDEIGRLIEAFATMVGALRRSVTDGTFATQLRAALEMVDTEGDVIEVLGEAVNEVVPAYPTEFLLADASKSHMRQSTVRGPLPAGPGCPVDSPFGCAAVRSGQTTIFTSSGELGTCPHLRDRPYGMVSAACVPVTFMGRALGVIHTVGPAGTPLAEADVERLRVLAAQAGSRIGMVRAFDRTQLQAATDALTGLPNRRTLEARAHELETTNGAYTVVMFDLDHFKALNDTHGHETGDRALRRFAAVLRESIRPLDLAARFGGEEFVVVLPGAGADVALRVADRVRHKLVELAVVADVPAFTVSAGVASSARQGPFESVMRAADAALYQAKANGRDQVALAVGEHADEVTADLAPTDLDPTDAGLYRRIQDPDPIFDRR